MSQPGHSIQPVSESDTPALGELLYSCKLALAINRLLFKNWPNEDAQRPQYMQAVLGGLQDSSSECFKAVDGNSGDITGYLVLSRKHAVNTALASRTENDEELDEEVERKTPDSMNSEVLATVMKAVEEISSAAKAIDRFEVTYICVKPSSRHQGIGSQLMRICFDRAKAEGVPLVVCAEPAAYDFFVKLGFADTRHVDIDLRKWAPTYSGFGIFRLVGMIWYP